MNNDSDLSHISKQIQKETAEIQSLRKQAEHQRVLTNRSLQGTATGSPQYFEKEALRLDKKAHDLENQMDQLESAKAQIEKRIAELEAQRAQIDSEHQKHLADIDAQITQLRGSAAML
jgi:TolA-binding protein